MQTQQSYSPLGEGETVEHYLVVRKIFDSVWSTMDLFRKGTFLLSRNSFEDHLIRRNSFERLLQLLADFFALRVGGFTRNLDGRAHTQSAV